MQLVNADKTLTTVSYIGTEKNQNNKVKSGKLYILILTKVLSLITSR